MTMVEPEIRTEPHRALHVAGGRRHRRIAWVAGAIALVLAVSLIVATLPVPVIDGYLRYRIVEQVSSQVSCPGAAGVRAEVAVGGGPLVPQAVRRRLSEVRLTVPDATLNGVPHARFTATMRDVTQPAGGTHVGSMNAAITVNFRDLPAPENGPERTYRRADDGGLSVDVVMPASSSSGVRAKLFMKMRLRGGTAESVPERLEVFGRSIPAEQVSELAGGVRRQQLPPLPDGVTYRSIVPRADGVHIEIGGVSTAPLSTLPTRIGDRTVSYTAADGLLGINTSAVGVPVTIHTEPVLGGGALTLVPRRVRIFGGDHEPTDALGRLVLGQVDQENLRRTLPDLPDGVRYRSVSVDSGGIKVVVGGVTTRPFSVLRQPPGNPTVFGAERGLLTATTISSSDKDTPVVLYGRPVIKGNVLDMSPDQIEMFGVRFPAANVLAEVGPQQTTQELQKLPPGLAYAGVEVLPDGLRIRLTGQDVTLQRGALTGGAAC